MCDAAQVAPGEHRRDDLELDRRGYRIAFCGERAKDGAESPRSEKRGKLVTGLPVSVCQQCVRVNALRGRETTRAIRAVQIPQGIKTGPLPPCRWFAHAGPITWLNRSTNTARLICWRNWRNQVPATFSAARGRAGRRRFLSRCRSAKITWPTRAAVGTVALRPRFTTGCPRLLSARGQPECDPVTGT